LSTATDAGESAVDRDSATGAAGASGDPATGDPASRGSPAGWPGCATAPRSSRSSTSGVRISATTTPTTSTQTTAARSRGGWGGGSISPRSSPPVSEVPAGEGATRSPRSGPVASVASVPGDSPSQAARLASYIERNPRPSGTVSGGAAGAGS